MPSKKINPQESPADDQALVQRVDAMMSVRQSESAGTANVSGEANPQAKDAPIDIFEGLKTPPVVISPDPVEPSSDKPATVNSVELEDADLDAAVDEITVKESDVLLAAEDIVAQSAPPSKPLSLKAKLKRYFF